MNRKMSTRAMVAFLAVSIAAAFGVTNAAAPPDRMNYQGVLRDASGSPLDGSYDMVFTFYDASTGGMVLYQDAHVEGDAGQITVSGGLFSVRLGTGDKLGGFYDNLNEVFTEADVWLEVKVGLEILSPRIQIQAAGYAFNAANLNGRSADGYLDTSDVTQTKYGTLKTEGNAAGTYGLEGRGMEAGGFFEDLNGTGQAKLGHMDYGVWASGRASGGYFENPEWGTWARVADLWGIEVSGGLEVHGQTWMDHLKINDPDAIYLNHDGPEGDSTIYFYEGGLSTGARLRWDDSESYFGFNRAVRTSSHIQASVFKDDADTSYYLDPASAISGDLAGDLIIGGSSGTDDDYLYMDSTSEHLAWRNDETRFAISDDLVTQGALSVGAWSGDPFAYSQFGNGFPDWSDINSIDDLWVADDLEVGGDLGLNKVLIMEPSGSDGDQTIYFHDTAVWNSNYLRWDDISTITCGSLGSISSGFLWNIADNADSGWIFANGADAEVVIDEFGNLEIDGSLHQSGSCDLAETFFGPEGLGAGTVVVLDPDRPEGVRESTRPYDPTVAGVVTTRPGVLLSGPSADAYPVWKELERVEAMLAVMPPEPSENNLESSEVDPVSFSRESGMVQGDRLALEQRISELEIELDGWARGDVAVALVGRVPVKADASYGPIRKGDYLTTSATPGHARVLHGPGPYMGIAMDDLAAGRGEVLVFLDKGWYGGTAAEVEEPEATEPASAIARVQEMDSDLEIVLDRDADDRSRFSVFRDGGAGISSEVFRVDERGNVFATGSFRPAAMDLAEFHPVSEPVGTGDVLVVDRDHPGRMALGRIQADPAVVGIVSTEPGVLLGSGLKRIVDSDADLAAALEIYRSTGNNIEEARLWAEVEERFTRTHAAIALSGTVPCKVDAGYGSIRVGDLLTVSPTPGHAMRAEDPARQGTVLGKALEPMEAGTGTIRVLVMMR